MKKLSKEQILMLHSQLIQQTGGSDGVRDYTLLESAIETPFQSFGDTELYPTLQAGENITVFRPTIFDGGRPIDGSSSTYNTPSASDDFPEPDTPAIPTI